MEPSTFRVSWFIIFEFFGEMLAALLFRAIFTFSRLGIPLFPFFLGPDRHFPEVKDSFSQR